MNWGTTIDDVYTLSPSLLLNIRAGWTRFIEGNTRQSTGFDPTSVGLPAYIEANSTRLLFPRIDFGQITDLSDSGGDTTPFDTFQIFSTLTKIAEQSYFEVRRRPASAAGELNQLRQLGRQLSIQYELDECRHRRGLGPARPGHRSVHAWLPTGGSFDLNTSRTQSANYYAGFVQDDWRVKPNFTLNHGLRYERETGTVERFNRTIDGFRPERGEQRYEGAQSSIRSQTRCRSCRPAQFRATGGVMFANDDRCGTSTTHIPGLSVRGSASRGHRRCSEARLCCAAASACFITLTVRSGLQQPGFSQNDPI